MAGDNFAKSLAVLVLLSAVAAQHDDDCPADPYASPSTDDCNPLRYIPNKPINIAAAVLYFVVGIILTGWCFRHRANYFLCLVIGAYCEGVGLVLRVIFASNPHSTGIYIASYLFVVLSPCAFLAGDYILLGRLVQYLEAPQHLKPLKPSVVARSFIISDVTTFLIQAAGGGLSISKTPSTAEAGGHIFLAGIALQMASFIFFTCACIIFAVRAYRRDKELWNRPGWKRLFWALAFTCVCFLIRSIYRTVELGQGYIGYLATHERYFLGLDTLPLLLGIATYTIFWPGRFLKFPRCVKKNKKNGLGSDTVASEQDQELAHGHGSNMELSQVGHSPVDNGKYA